MSKSATHERVQLSCTKGALMVAVKSNLKSIFKLHVTNLYDYLDRFLIPHINRQATEPFIETVNSISQCVLPISITQALIHAMEEESGTAKIGFSTHEAMNGDIIDEYQYSDVEHQNPLTRTYTDEEDEDENERFPRSLDYIDVSDQGTILNATRIDRVVKERQTKKTMKQDSNPLSHADISYLFDMNIPVVQRETLLMNFELPSSTRNQLMGALTALSMLMENDHIVGNIMTGESFKYPILDLADDIAVGIDDISAAIYNSRRAINETCIHPAEAAACPLADNIRRLVQGLVHLSLQPVLEEWAQINHRKYPLSVITETKASEIYTDAIQWICSRAKIIEYHTTKYTLNDRLSSEDDFNSSDIDSDSSSDEGGLVSVHKQVHRTQRKASVTFKSDQSSYHPQRISRSDNEISSDSEDQIGSNSNQGRSISTQLHRQRRKIESASGPLRETKRKGGHFDLDDSMSISYASEQYLGFSNRALVLLISLLRNGMDYTFIYLFVLINR